MIPLKHYYRVNGLASSMICKRAGYGESVKIWIFPSANNFALWDENLKWKLTANSNSIPTLPSAMVSKAVLENSEILVFVKKNFEIERVSPSKRPPPPHTPIDMKLHMCTRGWNTYISNS